VHADIIPAGGGPLGGGGSAGVSMVHAQTNRRRDAPGVRRRAARLIGGENGKGREAHGGSRIVCAGGGARRRQGMKRPSGRRSPRT